MTAMDKERGRPRSFAKSDALDLALPVFWRLGYQGASLAELTAATGLNKPSLYAAFGDKEALFLRVLERYAGTRLPVHAAVLEGQADARPGVEGFLRSLVAMYSAPDLPGGCLVMNGAAACRSAVTPPAVEAALRAGVQGCEALLTQRLQRAQREGQLGAGVRVKELAAYFNTVLAGLSTLARSGASRARLEAVVEIAMAAWPKPSRSQRGAP